MVLSYKCKQKYFVVFGGFLIFLTLGVFNTSKNLRHCITNYMKNHSSSGFTYQDTTLIFALMGFGTGTSMTAGGFLNIKIGPTYASLLGSFILSINISLAYFTLKAHFIVIILSYGFLGGVGIGFVYGVALGTPCTWFLEYKGLVFGIIVIGYELSAPLFEIIQSSILNSLNSSPIENLPNSFLYMGCIYLTLQIVGSVLLTNKPSVISSEIYSSPMESNILSNLMASKTKLDTNTRELQPHQLLKDFNFWILWWTFFLMTASINLIIHCLNYVEKIYSWSNNSSLTIVPLFCNCLGRLLGGYLTEKLSYKVIMRIITINISIFSFLFLIMLKIDNANISVYCLISGVISLFSGGIFSVFPVMTAELYGMKYFISNYGLLFTSCSVGASIISIVISIIFEYTKKYSIHLWLSGSVTIMSLLATGLTFMFRGKSVTLKGYLAIF